MDLFAVPTGRYVTPFEDVYRAEKRRGQAHGVHCWAVRLSLVIRAYREAGATLDSDLYRAADPRRSGALLHELLVPP